MAQVEPWLSQPAPRLVGQAVLCILALAVVPVAPVVAFLWQPVGAVVRARMEDACRLSEARAVLRVVL